MARHSLFQTFYTLLFACLALLAVAPPVLAETAEEIDRAANEALVKLYELHPEAQFLAGKARAILIFPKITRAGLVLGGEFGKGALREGDKTRAYFNSAGVSYGLQAGVQQYAYALFFMTDGALQSLYSHDGFEVGVGPSVVVVDEGAARSLTTRNYHDDVYAFIFGQHGLMAGVGIQGSKITRINP